MVAVIVVDDGDVDDSILIKDLFDNAEHDIIGTCLIILLYIVHKCNVRYKIVKRSVELIFSQRIQVNDCTMNAPRSLILTSTQPNQLLQRRRLRLVAWALSKNAFRRRYEKAISNAILVNVWGNFKGGLYNPPFGATHFGSN